MARLFTNGFELNSTAADVEWTSVTGAGSTIQTGTVRSGTYAGRVTSLVSSSLQGFLTQFATAYTSGPFFVRAYIYVGTLPSAENSVLTLVGGTTLSANRAATMTLDQSGVFRLYSGSTGGTLITGTSAAIATGAWHCLEMWIDQSLASGSRVLKARLDGAASFAASSSLTLSTAGTPALCLGANLSSEAQTTGNWYFDDVAVNDGSGSYQNSYPGPGSCIVLRPAGTGDANVFPNQVGGTAGASKNYTRVDEATPDDGTTYNGSHITGQSDLFTMTASGITSTDVVNVVAANVRVRNNTATATTTLKLQIEKTSGGTLALSSAFALNYASWTTNSTAAPHVPPLTLYNDPDGSPWTQATLDTMQAGYKIDTGDTYAIYVSTLWVYVDHAPASAIQTTKDTASRFRQAALHTSDSAARWRLASTPLQTASIARLRLKSAAASQDSLARVRLKSAATPHDSLARVRLASVQATHDSLGRVRLKSADIPHDSLARVRVASSATTHDSLARLRLKSVDVASDSIGRLRLKSANADHDSALRLRLASVFAASDSIGRLRLKSGVIPHDSFGRLRLASTEQVKDITSRVLLQSEATRRCIAMQLHLASESVWSAQSTRMRLRSADQTLDAVSRLSLSSAPVRLDPWVRLSLVSLPIGVDSLARMRLAAQAPDALLSLRWMLMSAATASDTRVRLGLSSVLYTPDVQARLRLAAVSPIALRFLISAGLTIRANAFSRFHSGSEWLPNDAPVRFLLSLLYQDTFSRLMLASVACSRDQAIRFIFGSPDVWRMSYNDNLTMQARVLTDDDYAATGGVMTLCRANQTPVTYSFSPGDFLCHKWVGTVEDQWIETQSDFAYSGMVPVGAPDAAGFVIYSGLHTCLVTDLDNGYFSCSTGIVIDYATFWASHTLNTAEQRR